MNHPLPPAIVIYLAGFSAAMNVGKLPPALPVLRQSMDLTLFEASLLVSAFQFAGMGLGIFGGGLADRFGLRRVMVAGLALLALAAAVVTAIGGWKNTWWVTGALAGASLAVARLIGRHARRLAARGGHAP